MSDPSMNMPSVWSTQTVTGKNKLEKIQSRAGRFVTSRYKRTDSKTEILRSLNWCPLVNRTLGTRLLKTSTAVSTSDPINFPCCINKKPFPQGIRIDCKRSMCGERDFLPCIPHNVCCKKCLATLLGMLDLNVRSSELPIQTAVLTGTIRRLGRDK